jgi:hypothetical protein
MAGAWGVIIGLLCYFLILGEGVCARADNFLTVTQMKDGGITNGIPLLGHGGILSDAILLTPMMIFVVRNYSNQWSGWSIICASVVSVIITAVMHIMWVKGAVLMPEALTHDGKLTEAGGFHAGYMMIALVIIVLFYFATESISREHIIAISVLLAIHLVVGTHVPLSLLARFGAIDWYSGRNYRDPATLGLIAFVWGILIRRCW